MVEENKSSEGEQPTFRVVLPRKSENEMFAIVTKLQGTDQVKAIFQDGVERGCRITGKLKKKVWIREGDLIIAKIWDFQPSKADIVWRYLEPQKNTLARRGLLKGLPV